MIKAQGICKRFGWHSVLNGVSFVVNRGECAALVGPNGGGKTTLLRIVAGEVLPDAGSIRLDPRLRLAYVRQGYADFAAYPARDVFPALFAAQEIDADLTALESRLAEERDSTAAASLADAYASALARRDSSVRAAVAAAARQLRLRDVRPDEPVGALSGGEQTKLGLLEFVALQPDALLLDEPTNNLDIDGLEWLHAYLRGFHGPVLLVSHDRSLLDDHATTILELDPRTGCVEAFHGNYTAYRRENARRESGRWDRYRRQQERARRVQRAIRAIKERASRTERRTTNDFYRHKAAAVARRAVVLERRRRRELDSETRVEKPIRRPYRLKAQIEEAQRGGDRLLHATGLTLRAGERELLRGIELTLGWGERIALVAPNGSGKTTLLRALAGEIDPSGGAVRRAPPARIGYLRQEEARTDIDFTSTPFDMIRRGAALSETEARRFLHRFLFSGDDVFTPVGRLSYGERRRLALARLVVTGANLLLLDEPTNHLDIPSREAFEEALAGYRGAMFVITHDRYFIERFAHRVLTIEDTHLREV